MNQLYFIVGTLGVGKSTYTEQFANSLSAHEVKMDELFKENPFFPLAVKNRKRWSLASDLWFLKKRIDAYSIIPALLERSSVVVDSGIPMSLAYADTKNKLGYMTSSEYDLFNILAGDLLKNERIPDKIIHLKASLPVIRERMIKRGRPFELKYFTDEYIQQLADSVETIMHRYEKIGTEIEEVYL